VVRVWAIKKRFFGKLLKYSISTSYLIILLS
jgi:hypothetical protein